MTTPTQPGRSHASLFPALLKFWRGKRGLSQLDLALSAEISARHLSFLETGRSKPGREMVLRLADTLALPMRDQNAMLEAAGFEAAFAEPEPDDAFAGPIKRVLDRMLEKHEPYPMVIMNHTWDLLRMNEGAMLLMQRFAAEPETMPQPLNLMRAVFDPAMARPFVSDWPAVARALLARLHRDTLLNPRDAGLIALRDSIFALPDVPSEWSRPDFSVELPPVFTIRLRREALELTFVTTLTQFSAPGNVTLEELKIESYFPADAATEEKWEKWCRYCGLA